MAQDDRVGRQRAVENFRLHARLDRAFRLGEFLLERERVGAGGQLGLRDRAVLVQDRQRKVRVQVAQDRRFLEMDLKAERERAAGLHDRAAGGRHDDGRIVVEELHVEVFRNVFLAAAAHALHRLRHSEEVADEMRVMHVQIEHRAPHNIEVVVVNEPLRVGRDAEEVPAEDFPPAPVFFGVDEEFVGGEEREHVTNIQDLPGFGGGLGHRGPFRGAQGDRLLAENVLSALQSHDRGLSVLVRREANVHHVHVRIRDHVGQLRVTGERTHVHHGPLRTEISLDRGPVPGQTRLIVLFAERDDFHPRDVLVGEVVDHPHETDSGNSDFQHAFSPWAGGLK